MKELVDKTKSFLIEAYNELKRVTWPTKDQTIRLTGYVIGVSLGVAVFVWAVDYLFKELLSVILVG